MTDPTLAEPGQDDLTAEDHLVEQTDNGSAPDDPTEQPSQDPGDLPAGTVTDAGDLTPAPATELQPAAIEDLS